VCKLWLILALTVLLPAALYSAGLFNTQVDPLVVATN
jgi:hypothetical protein